MNYKFSVGKIIVDGNTIATCTGITVRHDGGPVEYRGGDYRHPMWINLGAKSLEVSIESAEFEVDPAGLNDSYVTVELQTGAEGGGLTGTLTNMKMISYEVRQAQDAFVVSTMTLKHAENPV